MSKARELADVIGTQDTTENVLQGRKNLIINGAMQVAQRGTSFSASGTIYTLDRWEVFTGNVNCTTTQEEFTVGQTDVPHNPTHYLNVAKNGESELFQVRQKLEDVRILSGETVTLSFWANTSATIGLDIFQNFGSGGSAQVQVIASASFTVVETNNNWSKYQITTTLNSVSGKTIGSGSYTLLRIREQSASTNGIAITGVQLEVGSVATPFEHRSYGEELALCQRYYYRVGYGYNIRVGHGYMHNTTGYNTVIYPKTSFRATPTLTVIGTPKIVQEAIVWHNTSTCVMSTEASADIIYVQGSLASPSSMAFGDSVMMGNGADLGFDAEL